MHKTVTRRLFRPLLAGGLCLVTLTAAGAANQGRSPIPSGATNQKGSPVPISSGAADQEGSLVPETLELWNPLAFPDEWPDAGLDAGKEKAALWISALLSWEWLTEAEQSALAVRAEREPALLERLGIFSETELALLALPNAQIDRLDRYLAWMEAHPEDTVEDAVLRVNMDQDKPFYSAVSAVADPSALTVLVNKHYALPDDYVPELETLGHRYGSGSLRPEAAQAFRAMADAARADGVSLCSVSAYRSYGSQKVTYNNYLSQYKRSVVDTFSARSGHSEHQTGLALDINVASSKAHFEKTSAFAWLKAHCAEYGFILRYDQGKEAITGYRFEPWHYRYVGADIAQACMEQGLCYEEYLALQDAVN